MSALVHRDELPEEYRDFRFYYYEPSMAAAIIFTVLFAAATMVHTYQLVRSRTWFMIPFMVGGICEFTTCSCVCVCLLTCATLLVETVGYIGRTLSATENPGPYDKIPYIIQSLLLLVAPPLFAASVYMELGRIVLMVEGDSKLFIRRSWLTKIFVIGDVACFMVQAYGSSMMASKDVSKINIAHYVVIGGLFLQVAFFGLFVVVATIFHIRLVRSPTLLAHKRPWLKHMTGLYIVSILILVRSIVRGVEFIQGYDGYIMTHEAFLYAFDAVPMFIAVVTMNMIHPGEVAQYVRGMKSGGGKGDYLMADMENTDI